MTSRGAPPYLRDRMTLPDNDPMRVFDRRLVRLRRDRAAATVAQVAPVLEAAADRLLDRLDDTTRRFSRALEIGGRGVVAPLLRARGIPFVVSMDLSARMAGQAGGRAVAGDEEWLPFAEGSFDLVVASLSLHWVNDLPGALLQIRRLPDAGRAVPRLAARPRHAAGVAGGAGRGRERAAGRVVATGLALPGAA